MTHISRYCPRIVGAGVESASLGPRSPRGAQTAANAPLPRGGLLDVGWMVGHKEREPFGLPLSVSICLVGGYAWGLSLAGVSSTMVTLA